MEDQRGWYPSPRRSLPVYTINDGGTQGMIHTWGGRRYYLGGPGTVGIIAATYAAYTSGVTTEGCSNPFGVGTFDTVPYGK